MRASALTLSLTFATSTFLTACGGGETESAPAESATPDGPIVAPAGAKADGAGDDGVPTLTFDAAYGESLSGPVVAGRPLRVRFALERIPDCRGTQGGYPQWGVTGFFMAGDAEPVAFEVSRVEDGDRVPEDALLDVPRTDNLAFWFEASNRWGCHAYDSNFGENYHVAVSTPPAEATLDFGPDGGVEKTGDLVPGGLVRVRYDLDRLSQCRGTQGGMPQWNITGHLRVDDAAESTFEVSRVEGADRVSADAVLEVPAGRSLALWFTAGGRWGCHEADDQGGAGYRFDLRP